MRKYSIFNKKVVIEKKTIFDRFFKIQISREVVFLECKISATGDHTWNFTDKNAYDFWEQGKDKVELTPQEEKEILDFVRFKILFEAYKYSLDGDCPSLTVVTKEKKETRDGMDKVFLDYVKEVRLQSQASSSSPSQILVLSLFNGVVTPEGENWPLAASSLKKSFMTSITIHSRREWITKTLGEFVPADQYQGVYGNLATIWFVNEVLPKYFMREFMKP